MATRLSSGCNPPPPAACWRAPCRQGEKSGSGGIPLLKPFTLATSRHVSAAAGRGPHKTPHGVCRGTPRVTCCRTRCGPATPVQRRWRARGLRGRQSIPTRACSANWNGRVAWSNLSAHSPGERFGDQTAECVARGDATHAQGGEAGNGKAPADVTMTEASLLAAFGPSHNGSTCGGPLKWEPLAL